MFLHNDRELFSEVIYSTAAALNLPVAIVEKDYYVTMILKQLAENVPECVFKGGTSLSKCFHIINRFSEDIDISFSVPFSQGKRKKLKDETIAGIRDSLGLPIIDWNQARSRRDYNCYTFSYQPLDEPVPQTLIQGVKMETSFAAPAFPTELMNVDSYVYQFLQKDNSDIAEEYGLVPFPMHLQSVDRTLADKVFALCDYYLQGKQKRHSRHIYDIYMLLPHIKQNEDFAKLVQQVRRQRAATSICPSAQPDQNISQLLQEIIQTDFYKDDYTAITAYFQKDRIPYEQAIEALQEIIAYGCFCN